MMNALTERQKQALIKARDNNGYWSPCGLKWFHATAWALYKKGLIIPITKVEQWDWCNQTTSSVRTITLTELGTTVAKTLGK